MRAARVMVVHVPPYSDCNMGFPGDHRVVHHLKHWLFNLRCRIGSRRATGSADSMEKRA